MIFTPKPTDLSFAARKEKLSMNGDFK